MISSPICPSLLSLSRFYIIHNNKTRKSNKPNISSQKHLVNDHVQTNWNPLLYLIATKLKLNQVLTIATTALLCLFRVRVRVYLLHLEHFRNEVTILLVVVALELGLVLDHIALCSFIMSMQPFILLSISLHLSSILCP